MTKRQTPAQIIKTELKKAFPWVKFSCKYKTFSGWDSVDIDRKGWPLCNEVERIADQYQAWHFDWMIDLYEYTNDKPYYMTAKYVMCNREDDAEQTEKWIKDMWYSTDQLVKDYENENSYDRHHMIAGRIRYHLDEQKNNKWDNYSRELYKNHEEIWYIIWRYIDRVIKHR